MRIALALFAALLIAQATIASRAESGAAQHTRPASRPQLFAELTYSYTAETVAPVLRAGDVRAGAIIWRCGARRCTTRGPWPRPSVDACAALAAVVGRIAAYGRSGAMLSEKQLGACNAHAASPRVELQNPAGPRLPRQPPVPNPHLPPLPPGAGPGTRDVGPPVEITVSELSVVGGAVCTPTTSGVPATCITVSELSVIGGVVGLPRGAEPPINIPTPELSVIGE